MTVRQAMKYTEVDIQKAKDLIFDDAWVFEQKLDGTCVLAVVTDQDIVFYQRNGKVLAHTASTQHLGPIRDGLRKMWGWTPGEGVFVGELMFDTGEFHIFDVPYMRAGGVTIVTPESSYQFRRSAIESVPEIEGTAVKVVRMARTVYEKNDLLRRVSENNGEGVVAKHVNHMYLPGVRSKEVLKLKLVKTADVVVIDVDRPDPKHGSITFGYALDNQDALPPFLTIDGVSVKTLGKCSAIGKPDVQRGDVIEIRYLSYVKNGSPVQPAMVRARPDKPISECTIDQFPIYSKGVV